jgi:hypothetical protein
MDQNYFISIIVSKIVKNHLTSNRYIHILIVCNNEMDLDIDDIRYDMFISIIELLEK